MNYLRLTLIVVLSALSSSAFCKAPETIFIEAESFSNRGGWVIDQQVMDIMGSAYMLAHGLGKPVADAQTTIKVPSKGNYRVWVRTRDWVAPWKVEGAPGKFQLLIEDQPLKNTFGTEGAEWHWQYGGSVRLKPGLTRISLHDLTGFEGRCDAIILTTNHKFKPPNQFEALSNFRHKCLGLTNEPEDAGEYDLVVVGGGMAGICAAVSAARLGCRVALVQNRPVLGGNNSSEVRVGLSGLIYQEPYTNLGSLVDEIGPVGHWNLWEAKQDPNAARSKKIFEIIKNNPEKLEHNVGPESNYNDDKKLRIVLAEENLSLFLNTHVLRAEKDGDHIVAVVGRSIITGKEYKFKGKLFADCTGDGNLGTLANAEFRVGREAKSMTGEDWAPEEADLLVMGTSVQWNSAEEDSLSYFPDTSPWAVEFNEQTSLKVTKGDWNWETGATQNQITEIEKIRDYSFRVIYGNWDFIKNKSDEKETFAKRRLTWLAYIGGKRESRRLLGDIILTEQDIVEQKKFPDGTFTTTWDIDLHFPVKSNAFPGEPFRSRADMKKIDPYQVPYRCLYSRNVSNLFMAGRDISVTHVALGTVRVQRTTGMMGEVVGMAAAVCKENNTNPRGVYEKHFPELQQLMKKGIGNPTWSHDGEYFPPKESDGGWRKNTTTQFVSTLGIIPEKLEEFGQYNMSVPNSNWMPYSRYKGILVIKDGWIIGEWYNIPEAKNFKTYLSSNGKAFAMLCFGIMTEDGDKGIIPYTIGSESKVYNKDWLPQGFPLSDPRKSKISFEQIFQHTSGICPERTSSGIEVEKGRNQWTNYKDWLFGHDKKWPETSMLYFSPGHPEEYDGKITSGENRYAYSSVSMGHLGIVFQNVYEKPAHQFLWESLLEPIGFSGIDFHNPPSDSIKWFSAGGLCMTPRDYARFAYLLLHDGTWSNQQIVSSEWIQKFCTSSKYPNIRSNIDGCFGETYPKDMFRIAGSGINIAFIIPSLNMIVLRTGRVDNALWDEVEKQFLEKLFSAFQ